MKTFSELSEISSVLKANALDIFRQIRDRTAELSHERKSLKAANPEFEEMYRKCRAELKQILTSTIENCEDFNELLDKSLPGDKAYILKVQPDLIFEFVINESVN